MVLNYMPEELFKGAQLGHKLKRRDRLNVMVWLEKTGTIHDWQEKPLAQVLGCKVGALRRLRNEARQVMASAISPAEAMNYMTEFVRNIDFLIKEAYESIKAGPKNTGLHQGYMRLLMEANGEKVAKLQSIGVIPKELGRLTTVTEEWTAVIVDGVASVSNTSEGQPHELAE